MEIDPKLRRLQLAELEILDVFVRVCVKHGLRYYLVGGTLLGAVRHQGFIPWDDDIDVAMPREDYDRFADVAALELGPQYFYQCPETDPYYFLTYAKIRKNGTEVYEERFKNAKFHKGIFIDIFPLDFCPKPGLICHLLFNILAVMNYRGQVDSGEIYKPYSEFSGKLGYAALRLIPPRGLVNVRRPLLRLSKWLSRKEFVASYSGAYGYYNEIFPTAWFAEGSDVRFEGQACKGPAETERELTQIFGRDFMLPPPETEQKWHIDVKKCCFKNKSEETDYEYRAH